LSPPGSLYTIYRRSPLKGGNRGLAWTTIIRYCRVYRSSDSRPNLSLPIMDPEIDLPNTENQQNQIAYLIRMICTDVKPFSPTIPLNPVPTMIATSTENKSLFILTPFTKIPYRQMGSSKSVRCRCFLFSYHAARNMNKLYPPFIKA
jgi:hypothetical protein